MEDELELAATQEKIQANIQRQNTEKTRKAREKVESIKDDALKKFKKDKGVQKLTKDQCHALLCAEFKVFYSSSQRQKKKVAELREELKGKTEAVSITAPTFQLNN
jgi:hypothetical protein